MSKEPYNVSVICIKITQSESLVSHKSWIIEGCNGVLRNNFLKILIYWLMSLIKESEWIKKVFFSHFVSLLKNYLIMSFTYEMVLSINAFTECPFYKIKCPNLWNIFNNLPMKCPFEEIFFIFYYLLMLYKRENVSKILPFKLYQILYQIKKFV